MQSNVIKEVVPGVFWALLDCPRKEVLMPLLDPRLPYVLCWEQQIGHHQWEEFKLPLTNPKQSEAVLARAVDVDFTPMLHCDFEDRRVRVGQVLSRAVALQRM